MGTRATIYAKQPKYMPFVSTWKTDNTSTGSSTVNQVKLPLVAGGSYNFVIEWGDGSVERISAWNQANVTHTYATAGTYQITIKGKCIGWSFSNTGDRLKLLSIQKWGSTSYTVAGAYYGCANLTLTGVSDVINFKGVTSLNQIFSDCTSLTTINRISEWDMSSIVNTYGLFRNCTNFNDNVGNWNMSNVTQLSTTNIGMFAGAAKFNNGGSDSIKNWNVSNVTTFADMFSGASVFNQPIGLWNVGNATTMSNMFTTAIAFNQDLGAWNVTKVTTFLGMFAQANAFNNGGSTSIGSWVLNTTTSVSLVATFQTPAFNQNLNAWNTSKVNNMQGTFRGATAFNNGLASGVSGTMTWDTSSCTAMQSMFEGATAFNQIVSAWDVSKVTNFGSGTSSNFGMFQGATVFNNGLASGVSGTLPWTINTTSNVAMAGMFQSATSFNQDISTWNTSKVTTFASTFNAATNFNNGLASGVGGNMLWNTTSATTLASMFQDARAFNQNLGSLNLSNCTSFNATFFNAVKFNNGGNTSINSWTLRTVVSIDMSNMFINAFAFNQPIGSWNTIGVSTMQQMFATNTSATGTMLFNQPIGTWNVSNVTNLAVTFGRINGGNGLSFNQDLSAWNVTKVTNFNQTFLGSSFNNGLASGVAGVLSWITTAATTMVQMFDSTGFNCDVGSFITTNVTSFNSMFRNSYFNNGGNTTSMNSWNTGNVIDMGGMFQNHQTLTIDISSWNTAKVTSMNIMFYGSSSFNCNIGNWDIRNVTNFTQFMFNKTPATFSAANLDAIYNGWSTRPVKPSLTITFGTAKYTAAGSAGRLILTGAPNNWVIIDGGI